MTSGEFLLLKGNLIGMMHGDHMSAGERIAKVKNVVASQGVNIAHVSESRGLLTGIVRFFK